MRKSKRTVPAVNAGSMADIAFLLLIFFLVATQIVEDEGIRVRLPPLETKSTTKNKLLIVKVNKAGEILFEKNITTMDQIIPKTKEFLRLHKNKAVVSFQCEDKTSYENYIKTYQALKSAYLELWEEEADIKYGQPLIKISKEHQLAIQEEYPLKISEADPF